MDNLRKFRSQCSKIFVGILIFLVFSKLGIQYLWQGEISDCSVLVPIKLVPRKNDYFLHQKFELYRPANEWVSVLAEFLLKIIWRIFESRAP